MEVSGLRVVEAPSDGAGFALFPDRRYRWTDGADVSTGSWSMHPSGISFVPDSPSPAGGADADAADSDPAGTFLRLMRRPLTGEVFLEIADDRLSLTIARDGIVGKFRYDGSATST